MSSNTGEALSDLAGSQWGMVTAAQATAAGVARSTLLRRERTGVLERVRSGVYRLPGAPRDELDGIRAAWLAAEPAVPAWERLGSHDVVVGGAAAALAHEIGDLYPSPYLLYTATRRRTAHDDVRYSTRRIPEGDVMILDGLPVTTRERTIADLLTEAGADLSIVADALRDAERNDSDLDTERLINLLSSHARRLGHTSGADLYRHLRELSRIDEERLRDLLVNTDLAEQLSAVVQAQMHEVLAPLQARMNETMQAALAPLLNVKMPAVNLPPLKTHAVKLPPGVLPKIELPPTMQVAIGRLMPKLELPKETLLALEGLMPKIPAPIAVPKITVSPAIQAPLRKPSQKAKEKPAGDPATSNAPHPQTGDS